LHEGLKLIFDSTGSYNSCRLFRNLAPQELQNEHVECGLLRALHRGNSQDTTTKPRKKAPLRLFVFFGQFNGDGGPHNQFIAILSYVTLLMTDYSRSTRYFAPQHRLQPSYSTSHLCVGVGSAPTSSGRIGRPLPASFTKFIILLCQSGLFMITLL